MPEYLKNFTPGPEVGGQLLSNFRPIEESNVISGFKPRFVWTPQDEARAKKYGRITAEPKKTFWQKAKDIAWELVPFHQYMTEEGRRLTAALPHEAQAEQKFMQFTRLLDWVGGDTAIAFFGKRVMQNAAKETMKQGGEAVADNLIKNLEKELPEVGEKVVTRISKKAQQNQKYINEMFDDILLHPSETTTPELRQKVINSMFRDERNIALPLRPQKPIDQIGALQRANQKIINAETAKDALEQRLKQLEIEGISKKQTGTSALLRKGQEAVTVPGPTPLLKQAQKAITVSTKQEGWQRSALDMLDEKNIIYFHSGFPIDKKHLKDLVDDGGELLKKFWWRPEAAKDLKWWQEAASLPHWLAKKYPQIKRLYQVQMARQDARADILHAFTEGIESFFKLKGDDYNTCKKILLLGDREGKVFTPEQLARAGTSDTVIRAYQDVRETLGNVLENYFGKLKEWGIPEDEILKYRQQIGKIKGYFPRIRQGKYYIKAEKEGTAAQRIHFNSGIRGARIRKQLVDEGYRITESGAVNKLPEEIYFQISPEAISQVVDVASTGFEETIRTELRKNIADVFKERGWMRHGLSRQEYIAGFESDNLKDVLYNYLSGYSGFITKAEAAKKFRKTLADMAFEKTEKGIAAKETPRLYEYSTKYVRDVMANADRFDEISGKIRAAFFYKYLGAVVKSGFVNLTQNAIGAAPRLSLETKFAYAKLGKAMGDIAAHYAPKGGKQLAAEEIRALRIALNRGWTREQYMAELMGHIGKFGSVPRRIQKFVGGPMAISERYNRQSTFLAAFRVFRKEKGLAFEKAIEKAKKVVEDSHFVYGKSNLPGIFRGGKIQKLARTGYTFRTFTHNYINLLAHMGRRDPKAVAKSLAATGVIGGVSSLPFFKTAESIAQRFGYQPRSWIKEKLNEYGMGNKTEITLYGLPTLLDIDLGGSIGIEVPGQRTLTSEDPMGMLVEGTIDVMGVPASIVEDTVKSASHLHSGDVYRAIEDSPVTPVVVSNAMRAKRLATEGQTTMGGKPILTDEGEPVKLTKRQLIQKGVFGFQTPEATERYRQFAARKAEKTRWDKKRDYLLNKFARMANRYGLGSKQTDAAYEDIEKYNKARPIYADQITSETLMNRLTPKKKFKELMLQEAIK